MASSPPLVLDPLGSGTIQQLQVGNDVDIPANQRIDELETKLRTLAEFLEGQGIEIPEELLT